MFFYEPQALTLKILALFTVSKNQNPSSRYKNKLVPQYLYHHLKVSIPILFTFRWWWKYCANLFLSLGIYSCWMWKYWKFTKLFPGVLIIIAYCCRFSSYNSHKLTFFSFAKRAQKHCTSIPVNNLMLSLYIHKLDGVCLPVYWRPGVNPRSCCTCTIK